MNILAVTVPEDGLIFTPETLKAFLIREESLYGGVRLSCSALLDGAKIPVQIDVGVLRVRSPHVTIFQVLKFSNPFLRPPIFIRILSKSDYKLARSCATKLASPLRASSGRVMHAKPARFRQIPGDLSGIPRILDRSHSLKPGEN